MSPRWTLWRKTTYYRKSGFRVTEETESRIVIRTRKYGLLLGGLFFVGMGIGVAWFGFSEASDEMGLLAATLLFATLCVLFGFAAAWASRTQRDTIVVDRDLGTIRSERAKTRRRPHEAPFRIDERPLADLESVELRIGGGSGWLSFKFRARGDLDIDNATYIDHLRALGAKLATVAGVELRER